MKRNWLITIIFKDGVRVEGIRSHPANDPYTVRGVVEQIINKIPGFPPIDQIDVVPTVRIPADGSPAKALDWAEY